MDKTETTDEPIRCDICYETPDHEWEIIGFGCCRGKFCKECISKMMDSKDCPMCRKPKLRILRSSPTPTEHARELDGSMTLTLDSGGNPIGGGSLPDIISRFLNLGSMRTPAPPDPEYERCENGYRGCTYYHGVRFDGECPLCSYGDCRKHCATGDGNRTYCIEHLELCTNCDSRIGRVPCSKCCFTVKCKINCEELRKPRGKKWISLNYAQGVSWLRSPEHKIAFHLENIEDGTPRCFTPDYETIRELRKYCTDHKLLIDLREVYPDWEGGFGEFPEQGEMETYHYISDKPRIRVKVKAKKPPA